ncbi:DUF3857 domain-containing protein [Flavobacterium subsaxonicum]|uniref:DUF3857 domain-containing protein n=1 Tax=Flavobacterium subsaxonicum WB 4.1-42 = DSM 21790 TaxID=1121898 RepID=A0A0A2MXL1_9FLAO|nr:DUF3857 domain-containing protein [Flavobacterium subsaxonicum]KGO92960.1 hypothetical protein Q766_10060 [Flavobacterium subsaxonicum WB 4.1-42 = DSM 21790]
MRTRLLIMLLFLYSGFAFAQKKDKVQELFWGPTDAYKSVTAIPDKWKGESAVVIYKNEDYIFEKTGMTVTYTSSVRRRVKLLDQAAVKEFSEFSFKDQVERRDNFWIRKGTKSIGIKVIKPNGSETIIDVKEEAVKVEEGKKIAIPNLEIGDIIDYYFYAIEPFKTASEYGWDPIELTLGDEYPIMNFRVSFKSENDFFVNFQTYNGAPELKKVPGKDNEGRYELVATDIEKNDFPRWFLPLAEMPCYKFQVYFARNGAFEKNALAFLPKEESIIKQTVSKEEVKDYYKKKLWPYGDMADIERFLKKNTFKNDEEKVIAVYYFMRHQYLTRYIEAFTTYKANIIDPFSLYGAYPILMDSETEFIKHFMAFCKDNKISYDIIVATPRENGPIADLLLQANTQLLIKVNTDNPVYLSLFGGFTTANQLAYAIEGTNAYELNVTKHEVSGVKEIKLPATTHKDNRSKEVLNVTLSDDLATVNIARESSLYGHNKEQEQAEKLYFFNYVDEDYAKYQTKSVADLMSKKKKEQFVREFDALKNKLSDRQKEEQKESLQGEFGFDVADQKLEIVQTGRYAADEPFVYKEEFAVKNNLIKKTGQNYVIEIGKLISQQTNFEDKDRNRTKGVYMQYPRSYSENITFTIPAGYTVSGLDKLNKNVENATGGFISTAKIEGDKLIINTNKYYANYYEPATNWKNMLAFLDTAYQFTQEKILLKKN